MKKMFLIIIPLLAFLIFVAQFDDDLSGDASRLLKAVEAPGSSESYLYLAGIYANESESPEELGRKLLKEYRKQEADESYLVIAYQDSRKIALPEGELFCQTWKDGCLETLFYSDFDIDVINKEHEVLISRINTFHTFKDYRTLTKPLVTEYLPPYRFISAAERIVVLNAISEFKRGKGGVAMAALFRQFGEVKAALEQQDTLIGKLIFLMTLSDIVDVASIIISQEPGAVEAGLIPRLEHPIRDFSLVAAREFGLSYYTFRSLDRHPEIFEVGGNFPGWMTRMVYKPNMTINAITPTYVRLEWLAKRTPAEFSQEIERGDVNPITTSKLRNFVGGILIDIPSNFDEFVARFMDFEAKLALFNQRYHARGEYLDLDNPYYEGEPPEVLEEKVCFSGPLEDKRNLRCLRIKMYQRDN